MRLPRILPLLLLATSAWADLPQLDRGLVVLTAPSGGRFLSWRLLGDEPATTSFDVLRQIGDGAFERINAAPLDGPTHFTDEERLGDAEIRYKIAPTSGVDRALPSEPASLASGHYHLSIPLKRPDGGTCPDGSTYTYSANDASAADLDGDGSMEIVLRWEPSNSWGGSIGGHTGPILLDAYRLDGTHLWRINLGKNINAGAHLITFLAYDFDGDGRAEVACKTADGTIDGVGKIIGDAEADHRAGGPDGTRKSPYRSGHVHAGPEYLTVFNGKDGAAMDTVGYLPRRHPSTDSPWPDQMKQIWGDSYGNRMNRFIACVAHLDGERASMVFCRGYYTRTVLAAWDFRDGKIVKRWVFDSDLIPTDGKDNPWRGQGNHNLSVADVDEDGRDEIIYGAMVVDDDGTGLYSTGLGHGDAQHVSDLDPQHPGLEVFGIQERFDDAGSRMFAARNGEILWKKPSVKAGEDGEGPGRGLAADIDPRYPGAECWSAGAGITGLYNARGEKVGQRSPWSVNFAVWWDGDLQRELLDRNKILKWDWSVDDLFDLFVARGCSANNGTKSTPCLSGDILGDWREEVIWKTADETELRVYSTTYETEYRLPTLLHDRQYRLAIAWQNAGYNQPPHPSFYIGPDRPPGSKR